MFIAVVRPVDPTVTVRIMKEYIESLHEEEQEVDVVDDLALWAFIEACGWFPADGLLCQAAVS